MSEVIHSGVINQKEWEAIEKMYEKAQNRRSIFLDRRGATMASKLCKKGVLIPPPYIEWARKKDTSPSLSSTSKKGSTSNVDQAGDAGCTLLFIASSNGNVETVKLLLKAGGNVNQARTTDGVSPLYIASCNGNVDTVKVLLKAGANVNQAKTTDGCSPLFAASAEEYVDIVKVLIEAGGNVNQTNNDDVTPLFMAVVRSKVESVRYLLSIHNIDLKGWKGQSLIAKAKQKNNTEIIQLLTCTNAGAKE